MLKLRHSWLTRYGIALVLVAAATGLRLYIGKQAPLVPFIIAVMLSAGFGELGPGLMATILSAISNTWIVTPQHSIRGLVESGLGLSFFLVVSVAIGKLYAAHKKTDQAVLALKEGLEDRDRKLLISEENLQNETRVLKAILNSIGEGVVVADPNGKFLVFNPAAEQILGNSQLDGPPEEWSKRYGIYLPDTVTPFPSNELPLARALRGQVADEVEIFVRHEGFPDGVWISVTARPLIDERGYSRGGVAVLRNISGRKRAAEALTRAKEDAEQANRAKSEFLSRMSHELRTPLNSILGFAQVLQMGGELPARSVECVQHILKGGRHLLRLIDEVLDIARIESGRLPLSVEPVLMSDAISQTLEMVRPIAESRGIKLSTANSSNCGQHVMADRQRLQQVLLNLASNAIKYNRPNGSVRISCEAKNERVIRIKVEDTGHGISAEDQARLFAPFERLAAAQTDVEGTGLGLALSKNLIEAMGGTIGLTSEVGKGSTFWVELAVTEAPMDRVRREETLVVQIPEQNPQSLKVLYIEDNVANVQLIEHVFSYRPQVKLLTAMQGRLGLELAVENRPDLILLDLHLPDIRGDVVLHELQNDPRTRTIPAIMISADATPGQIRRLMDAGVTDYLTKPLDVEKLLLVLDEHLRRKSESNEEVVTKGRP